MVIKKFKISILFAIILIVISFLGYLRNDIPMMGAYLGEPIPSLLKLISFSIIIITIITYRIFSKYPILISGFILALLPTFLISLNTFFDVYNGSEIQKIVEILSMAPGGILSFLFLAIGTLLIVSKNKNKNRYGTLILFLNILFNILSILTSLVLNGDSPNPVSPFIHLYASNIFVFLSLEVMHIYGKIEFTDETKINDLMINIFAEALRTFVLVIYFIMISKLHIQNHSLILFNSLLILAIVLGYVYNLSTHLISLKEKQEDEYSHLIKTAEIGKSHLIQFIEHAPVAIAMFDRDIKYIAYTEEWVKEYKIPKENILGKSHYEVFPNISEEWKKIHQRCLKGELISNEADAWTPPGWEHEQVIRWIVRPWFQPDNTIGGIIMLSQDVTEKFLKEKELKDAQEKAMKALKIKSEFLATMSHEIRTPMNGVIGMIELLNQTKMNSEQVNYIQSMKISSEILMGIINDILDYSSLESGKIQLSPDTVEIRDTIYKSIDIFRNKVNEKELELDVSIDFNIPGYLQFDEKRFVQIFNNIFYNSIKFTNSKGNVSIRVSLRSNDSGAESLFVEIQDTGIGISDLQKEKIFYPFVQADSSTTKNFGGTGLGLAISKKLIDIMGGKIWFDSELNVGSTFCIEIPVVKSEKEYPEYLKKDDSDFINKKVIFLDYDNDNQTIYNQFYHWGSRLEIISNIESFFKILEHSKPDLICINSSKYLDIDVLLHQMNHLMIKIPILILDFKSGKSAEMQTGAYPNVEFLQIPAHPKIVFHKVNKIWKNKIETKLDKEDQIPESNKKRKFLIVEDVPMNQKIIIRMLEKMNIETDIADNGKIALEKVKEFHYDLIFMDLHMPVMDGETAIREIQASIIDPPPIIVLSADVFKKEEIMNSKVLKVVDYILKPVKFKDLEKVLKILDDMDSNSLKMNKDFMI